MAELGMAVPSSAGLSIDRVTKRFGEQTAVDALSLTINPGSLSPCSAPAAVAKPPCYACWQALKRSTTVRFN